MLLLLFFFVVLFYFVFFVFVLFCFSFYLQEAWISKQSNAFQKNLLILIKLCHGHRNIRQILFEGFTLLWTKSKCNTILHEWVHTFKPPPTIILQFLLFGYHLKGPPQAGILTSFPKCKGIFTTYTYLETQISNSESIVSWAKCLILVKVSNKISASTTATQYLFINRLPRMHSNRAIFSCFEMSLNQHNLYMPWGQYYHN